MMMRVCSPLFFSFGISILENFDTFVLREIVFRKTYILRKLVSNEEKDDYNGYVPGGKLVCTGRRQ